MTPRRSGWSSMMDDEPVGKKSYQNFIEYEAQFGRIWNRWESLSADLQVEWAEYEMRWGPDGPASSR